MATTATPRPSSQALDCVSVRKHSNRRAALGESWVQIPISVHRAEWWLTTPQDQPPGHTAAVCDPGCTEGSLNLTAGLEPGPGNLREERKGGQSAWRWTLTARPASATRGPPSWAKPWVPPCIGPPLGESSSPALPAGLPGSSSGDSDLPNERIGLCRQTAPLRENLQWHLVIEPPGVDSTPVGSPGNLLCC